MYDFDKAEGQLAMEAAIEGTKRRASQTVEIYNALHDHLTALGVAKEDIPTVAQTVILENIIEGYAHDLAANTVQGTSNVIQGLGAVLSTSIGMGAGGIIEKLNELQEVLIEELGEGYVGDDDDDL